DDRVDPQRGELAGAREELLRTLLHVALHQLEVAPPCIAERGQGGENLPAAAAEEGVGIADPEESDPEVAAGRRGPRRQRRTGDQRREEIPYRESARHRRFRPCGRAPRPA